MRRDYTKPDLEKHFKSHVEGSWVRKYYTKSDLEVLKEKYIKFHIDGDNLVVTSKTMNPTYKNDTRQDNVKDVFRLRHKNVRVLCFKPIFMKVLEAGQDPLELMMRLHNYSVSVHKYISKRTLDTFLDVLDVYLSPEVSVPDGVIMVMQGILR